MYVSEKLKEIHTYVQTLVSLMIRWLQLYMIMEVICKLLLGYFMTIQDGLVLMRNFKYIPSIAALLAVSWLLQT